MPSTLAKTRKQIAKKRQGNIGALHQGSRDSKRLHKAQVRDERLEKIAASRKKNEQPMSPPAPPFPPFFLGDIKLTQLPKSSASPSFKTQCKRTDTSPSLPRRFSRRSERESQTNLLTSFLLHDEEFEAVKKARRPGRPASAREDLLKLKIATLEKEYKNGLLLPELTTEDNVALLERWEGSWTYLTTLAWVRISESGTVSPSSFPPKGDH
ncbi:uncharacterized protein E0L32_002654 [Thyridium curvatum]|uniref:Translation machinery-associated protein 16 n=1 Tax=Thyridium curvatum TaxID=1093900 RepID=A0A507B4T5_9PEZI|nr:uncharacterized protein E0L32_002654 [Thyridium curvatum]TPX18145.1 hypothetical protein E0L32_002654 [Thyridium curvatum]